MVSVPETHWPAWQQPLVQLVASHTHWPATHRSPAPHAWPEPHRHVPPWHESLVVGSHVRQFAPAAPQDEAVAATQVFPLQQPLAQLVASQTHRPPTQRCPELQAGLEPQRHCPLLQVSDVPAQARQSAPASPQVWSLDGWQTPFWQQPLGQF
jgi:hypothetical protein